MMPGAALEAPQDLARFGVVGGEEALGIGTDADAFFRRQRGGINERPACLRMQPVHSFAFVGPGDLAERLAIDERAVLPVQAVEVAVAVRLYQRLHRLAIFIDIDQY